jgi:hypothetical protein
VSGWAVSSLLALDDESARTHGRLERNLAKLEHARLRRRSSLRTWLKLRPSASLVFPAAPPWLATQNGYLGELSRVLGQTINFLPERVDVPSLYNQLNPNPVAAIPSLHAAYPLLVLLFALRFFGRRALVAGVYVLAVWLALIYLGEHYAIDVFLGAVYAGAAFVLGPPVVWAIERARSWRPDRTRSFRRT